jgi:hypothetical protein
MNHPDYSFLTGLYSVALMPWNGDEKMSQIKRLLLILLGVALVGLSISSVFADPLLSSGSVAVGDRYLITTIRGEARAWIADHWVTGPVNLQLLVQVTYAGTHNVIFKVLSGTFQVNNKPYSIDVGQWHGDYNRDTHTAVYQGPATAPDGKRGYFVLYGRDTAGAQQGVFMNIWSDFVGEYGALWHIKLQSFRTKVI